MADRQVPIGCRESTGDAAGATCEIRGCPIAYDGLVDEHLSAEVGSVAPLAADSRLHEVLPAPDRVRQCRLLHVNAAERICRRGASGDPFIAQHFEFGRTQGKWDGER